MASDGAGACASENGSKGDGGGDSEKLPFFYVVDVLSGPVAGAMCNRYSVRTAFIIGSSLSSLGLFLTGIAPNVYFLFFSHTLLEDLGQGLLSGYLAINLYFDKHCSLATGLASAGVGVGVGALWEVPLIDFLFDLYGYTGAFMLICGLALQGLICAMLLRPLSLHNKLTRAARTATVATVQVEEEMPLADLRTNHDHKHDELHQRIQFSNDAKNGITLDSDLNNINKNITDKESFLMVEQDRKEKVNFLETKTPTEGSERFADVSGSHGASDKGKITTEQHVRLNGTGAELSNTKSCDTLLTKFRPETHRKCSFFRSSLQICFPVEHKRKGETKTRKVFHWSLLKHIPFIVFCLSGFLFQQAFHITLTFLPAIAISKGLSSPQAVLLMTISGALDTFSRIVSGFILDWKVFRAFRFHILLFNGLLFVMGGTALLIPALDSFVFYGVLCAVYGSFMGAFLAQRIVVLVDILGRELMPSSLGILKLFQALGTLVGPPLAGALKDILGNYDSAFYLCGASMFSAGLLMILSHCLLRLGHWHRETNSQTDRDG